MDHKSDDEADTTEDLIKSFIHANSVQLSGDPVQALQRLERLLAKFPALSEEARLEIREALLGRIH